MSVMSVIFGRQLCKVDLQSSPAMQSQLIRGVVALLWLYRYWRRTLYLSWRLRILPVDVMGSSSANSTMRGYL